MEAILLVILLGPLVASAIVLLGQNQLSRKVVHSLAIAAVFVSFCLSIYVLYLSIWGGLGVHEEIVYTWGVGGPFTFSIGFLIDRLSALMMCIVTFVSFAVHVYTIGYMDDDSGYKRFFGYIALFTFSMLLLVMANNFMQLFMGWEMVGLVSYLLIGFWYQRDSATFASLKAFVVNRVGDFGFIVGIAGVLFFAGTLNYLDVFAQAPAIANQGLWVTAHQYVSAPTLISILLFVGAMGKSAQIPLHTWLPGSMEGPTPISALIHAATMVTAGIFMVARCSPLFSLSPTAMSFVLIVGATGAFFMGLIGIVQTDIKQVVAYSTISQLGYMTAALGAGAFAGGIFHLMTHATFKALLFLGAGSVIIAMHHEQDMRKMGGLARYMPITYITFLIGGLALSAFPGFAGFFSKDAIIDAVGMSATPGATYAYWCVLLGALVTTIYTFRMIFLTFHGKPRMDEHTKSHLKESPWVVTFPLILLAIPSAVLGGIAVKWLAFGDFFGSSIVNRAGDAPLSLMSEEFHGAWQMFVHGFSTWPFFLFVIGFVLCWVFYIWKPHWPAILQSKLRPAWFALDHKLFWDDLEVGVVMEGSRRLGSALWRWVDDGLIDAVAVNGTARAIGLGSRVIRHIQSGYLYHYAFVMVIGLAVMVGWLIWR
ncbi:MAG: NADH-quinone oxidoreductase subunit L [Gammaproteobacteria bacterium]|nr:NADH-quinone oxidoreductase subunit L [Gammaproteobacteria bacterium]